MPVFSFSIMRYIYRPAMHFNRFQLYIVKHFDVLEQLNQRK